MSGIAGARCTTEMKKLPRRAIERGIDIHIFGYTKEEHKRAADFDRNNPELKCDWILIEAGFSKDGCKEILKSAGIELPMMYRLGFKNNNCKLCVKATSAKYWNKSRVLFPVEFQRRAEQSRRIGCKLVRYKGVRIFLDELPPDAQEDFDEDLSCGPQCGVAARFRKGVDGEGSF
jgi:hypothetical protein